MSVTLELLDELKARLGGVSDYAVSKVLQVTSQQVSKWRREKDLFSTEKLLQVCGLLDKDPAPYLLRLQIERARCDTERDAWNALLARLAA